MIKLSHELTFMSRLILSTLPSGDGDGLEEEEGRGCEGEEGEEPHCHSAGGQVLKQNISVN